MSNGVKRNLLVSAGPPAVCLLLLCGLWVEAHSRIQPSDAEPFHLRCKAAVEAIPETFDDGAWVSKPEDIGVAATALLKPNAILSREYSKRLPNGRIWTASLLIVQCKDARDMQGHYPPKCYPANGAQQLETLPRTWQVGPLSIGGMEYLFTQIKNGGNDETRVYNFFVLPDVPGLPPKSIKGIQPDMDSVYKSGEDYQRRYYGASEFQLVYSNDLSRADRDQILTELLEPNVNVIQTLMNDHSAQQQPRPEPRPVPPGSTDVSSVSFELLGIAMPGQHLGALPLGGIDR